MTTAVVGRTPWSAAGPPAGLFAHVAKICVRYKEAGEGVGRGPGGPPHHSAAHPSEENAQ
jgi:hypothetical protein